MMKKHSWAKRLAMAGLGLFFLVSGASAQNMIIFQEGVIDAGQKVIGVPVTANEGSAQVLFTLQDASGNSQLTFIDEGSGYVAVKNENNILTGRDQQITASLNGITGIDLVKAFATNDKVVNIESNADHDAAGTLNQLDLKFDNAGAPAEAKIGAYYHDTLALGQNAASSVTNEQIRAEASRNIEGVVEFDLEVNESNAAYHSAVLNNMTDTAFTATVTEGSLEVVKNNLLGATAVTAHDANFEILASTYAFEGNLTTFAQGNTDINHLVLNPDSGMTIAHQGLSMQRTQDTGTAWAGMLSTEGVSKAFVTQ